ncbi:MAG: M20 family metallopeptidase [Methanohalobium sp.]|uniref:M20 metallopeptidase family protein n=1 Tax=Methanohalobium sp. TaxID=2837493 RepID=UPI00397C3C86
MTSFEKWIINIRRKFHRYPEPSFEEYRTQQRIIEILNRLGIESDRIAGTGVVATINGNSPGPCIALRADMDALRVKEEQTDLNRDYISQNEGIMHACGHDGHMAIVLGAARYLNEIRNQFSGSVRLVFQPAEEQPPGGASKIIEEGGIDDVDAIVGLHIFGDMDFGKIKFKSGCFMASSNRLNLSIFGKGGHHSNPGDCIDPVFIASDFLSSIHTEIQKQINPSKYAMGIGKIEGGEQFNRTMDRIDITGSLRTFYDEDIDLIKSIIKQKLDSLMNDYSIDGISDAPEYEFEILRAYPVLNNDEKFTSAAYNLLKEKFPEFETDNNSKPLFGAEDFAFYVKKIPGFYFTVGTKNVQKNIVEINHSSKFDIDEEVLIIGAHILKTITIDFLNNPQDYLQ